VADPHSDPALGDIRMKLLPLRRSTDFRPVPAGGLSPRDVYDFAKARADALRAELAQAGKRKAA
jgi:hypothetical protein